MSDVSVVGTGLMGAAIVRALLRSGHSVTVWNRSPAKAAPLVAEGAELAPSATEAVLASPVVVLVIFSYDNVRRLLEEAAVAGPVGDVVNLVTGSPTEASDLASWAATRQMHVLDGALLTYPEGIGGPDTSVFYSGDSGVWKRREILLRGLAGGSEYLGDQAGLANAMDHVTLSFVTVAQTAMFTTLAYAEALGVPRAAAVQQVRRSLSTMRGYLDRSVSMIEAGDFSTTEATIDTWVLSSRDFARGQREAGLTSSVVEASAETIRAAGEAGFGDLDLAAVYLHELRAAGLRAPDEPLSH